MEISSSFLVGMPILVILLANSDDRCHYTKAMFGWMKIRGKVDMFWLTLNEFLSYLN